MRDGRVGRQTEEKIGKTASTSTLLLGGSRGGIGVDDAR